MFVLVLIPLVQCFAWTARAMYLLARGRTRTGVRTGNVPACPCSYSYWYLLCSASLGQHGQCTYLPVVVLVLVSARVMYLLARVRTRTGTSCAVLRLDSTGNVPTCPWSYSYWYLLCSASLEQHGLCTYVPVLVSLYSACAVLCFDSTDNIPTCPWSYSYWCLLCSASLGQHGQCTYFPVVILVLVPLVQCFAWTARAMYLCARACILVQCLYSASLGQHGQCIYLPVVLLILVPLVQCFARIARAMYLCARACILVQCFVMGNPSHVRILVFGVSRCTCSATPTDLDSLLVMSRHGFYVRCICAGCLYLTCRGAIVHLPVCTADREGG